MLADRLPTAAARPGARDPAAAGGDAVIWTTARQAMLAQLQLNLSDMDEVLKTTQQHRHASTSHTGRPSG